MRPCMTLLGCGAILKVMGWMARLMLGIGTLLVAGSARAEDAAPRAVWLECAAPAAWTPRKGSTVELTCRVRGEKVVVIYALVDPGNMPPFWETINPFEPPRPAARADLTEPVAGKRFRDPFEHGAFAR